jgi:hypothetical protein
VRALVTASMLVAIGLTGCSLIPIQPPTADISANAPAAVANRIPVPPCGSEHSGLADSGNLEGRACFWTAYQEHRPAEFISTRPTTEGDPITTIYRVLPGGSVELFIDSTQDTWGSGKWAHATCRTLSPQVGADIDFGPDETCTFADIP